MENNKRFYVQSRFELPQLLAQFLGFWSCCKPLQTRNSPIFCLLPIRFWLSEMPGLNPRFWCDLRDCLSLTVWPTWAEIPPPNSTISTHIRWSWCLATLSLEPGLSCRNSRQNSDFPLRTFSAMCRMTVDDSNAKILWNWTSVSAYLSRSYETQRTSAVNAKWTFFCFLCQPRCKSRCDFQDAAAVLWRTQQANRTSFCGAIFS